MKFCVNCKHYCPVSTDCARPGGSVLNLVTGQTLTRIPTDAWHERYNESDTTCGKDAKYFKVKDGQ